MSSEVEISVGSIHSTYYSHNWKMQCLWKHLGSKTRTQRNTNDSFWRSITVVDENVDYLELVTSWYFHVSKPKQCSERATILELRGSHCKSGESTERGIGKWFPGMLAKIYECWQKRVIAKQFRVLLAMRLVWPWFCCLFFFICPYNLVDFHRFQFYLRVIFLSSVWFISC
jgi:hypothetical protein